MPDEIPPSIGPEIDMILKRVLPEPYAARRVQMLKQNADAVADVQTRARQVWLEMLGREVELLVFDRFTPEVARMAATNNLALRKLSLDEEVLTELERLQDDLRRRLRYLVQDMQDDQDCAG